MTKYKNILIIRLSAMGDVAMTVPVVYSFLKQYSDVHVTMVSNPRFSDLFSDIDNLKFIGVDTKKEYVGFWGIFKLFRHLTAETKFDAVFDLHDVLRSKVLTSLFRFRGVPFFRIDKGRKEKRALIRPKNKQFVSLKNSFKRYQEVFEKAGMSFPLVFNGLFDKKKELSENIVSFLGVKENKSWLAIAPFAQHKGKIYPLEKMETITSFFSRNESVKILLFGGGDKEKEILENWEKKYANVVSLVGKFNLREELHILNQSDLLLSMDSSNMHLASLVRTPVFSIWGATHPYAGFYGFNQDIKNAIQVDLPCRPCSVYGNKPCLRKDYACLNLISPEKVIEVILNYLNG